MIEDRIKVFLIIKLVLFSLSQISGRCFYVSRVPKQALQGFALGEFKYSFGQMIKHFY